MRSVVIFCTLLIVIGVSVARYADKVLVNPSGNSNDSNAAATRSSSSPITVVSPSRPAASSERAVPAQPALPEVIRMSPSSSSRTVTLRGDDRGQFKVEARVDGRRMEFMVDTGASAVALRASDAAKLGIHPSSSDYTVKTQTANGIGRAALARIDVIEIENIVVRDVVALVHPDDALKGNLLGMTFLSRIRFMHDRGRLVLEQ
jgi:aspartyl protease family protein